jgi:hypothetical protein
MKRFAILPVTLAGLLIVGLVVGCSKSDDAKQNVATNNGQTTKAGGDNSSTTNPATGPGAAGTGLGQAGAGAQGSGPAVTSGSGAVTTNSDVKPETKPGTKPRSTGGAGVSGADSKLVGKYKGTMKLPAAPAGDKQAEMVAKMTEAMAKTLALELKADKTFSMTMMIPIEGTWSRSGDTLSLKVETVAGQTMESIKAMSKGRPGAAGIDKMEKPMQFKVSADGKTLTAIHEGPKANGSMTFTKE